jgi:hypothetical protein
MLRIFGNGGRKDRSGVSEIVGTLLILVMTVALFSVIIMWVYGFPAPEGQTRVNLYPTMERLTTSTANVTIVHRGGETLTSSSVQILISIQNATKSSLKGPYNYSSGSGGLKLWKVGGLWSKVITDCPADARVELRVVDRVSQTMVLRTELQRGLGTGGTAPPIVGVPIILPDWEVVSNGSDTFYVRAVAVDYDNDLPTNGLVIDLRPIWNGLGTRTLSHKGFGIYESALVTVPASAIPGEYNLNVTATDSKGHKDTNWAAVRVSSPDKTAPLVVVTNPTSGEIAAGNAKRIVATYSDPSGILMASVTMKVWEDNVQLDTSSKTVTDTYVTFSPFGGFKNDAVYRVNVSASDVNGNIGYAETVFRMSTYSQPGNPQGETSFVVMNKLWVSTTTFLYNDYIRVQLWSEVIKQIDDSELRLSKNDATSVYIKKDRFQPNLTVPPFSPSFPFYVYDAIIDLTKDGPYSAAVPPAYYTLRMIATYAAGGLTFDDSIGVVVKYMDGSLPTTGTFWLYNETGKWTSSTRTFKYNEIMYIEVVSAKLLASGRTTVNKATVKISDVYGDNVLYRDVPDTEVTYAGTGKGGYLYRFQVDLKATVDGGLWFCGANWYPIEVSIQTKTAHRYWFFWWWYSYDTGFKAGDQVKIVRAADIAVYDSDLRIYHEDGTDLEGNSTLAFGEELFVNVTVWNMADVDISNARVQVWAVSNGVTMAYWDLTTVSDFWDPNDNQKIDGISTSNNFVQTNITWNTSKTGIDQTTLEKAKIIVHIDVKAPVIGGYGSDPVPEVNYDNNDATKNLLPVSDGQITVTNPGYTTPAACDLGQRKLLVDRVLMTAASGAVRIVALNVTFTGTATVTDMPLVYVYEDTNVNGYLDGGDRLVGSGALSGGKVHVNEGKIVKAGASVTYLVLCDISGTAVAGRTVISRIAVLSDVTVKSPATVKNVGFPFNSETSTVTSNTNKLTGTATGSANAFPGATVRYTLALDAKNTVVAKLTQGTLTITKMIVHVTASGSIARVRLIDDANKVIAEQASAATVTFWFNYTVTAAATRNLYVDLIVASSAAAGTVVGFQVQKVDVTLSAAEDSVDAALNLQKTSTVKTMASLFEYKAGNPAFDGSDMSVVQGIVVGITDATADVYIDGVTVSWTASGRPDWTVRLYIGGASKFEDDGTNHIGTTANIPLTSSAKLDTTGKTVRIEFNEATTTWGLFSGYSDNQITFTWHFTDGSTANGAKKVDINGSYLSVSIGWVAI